MSYTTEAPLEYLDCRMLRHAWRRHSSANARNVVGERAHEQILICDRCNTQRTDYYDLDYVLVSRTYRYPDGYRVHGEKVGTIRDLREAVLTRIKVRVVNSF